MSIALHRAVRLLFGEDGPAAVEYAVMLALIIFVCIGVVRSIGKGTLGSFGAFGGAMSAVGGNGAPVP